MINFNKIKPVIDKVSFTGHINYDNLFFVLVESFEAILGKNKYIKSKRIGYKFKNSKLWLGIPNDKYWTTIDFYPDEEKRLDSIIKILKKFPINRKIKVNKGDYYEFKKDIHRNIRSIELAFDIPFPNTSKECVDAIAEVISHYLFPKIPYRGFSFFISGKNKICSDGAINGSKTFYWKYPKGIKNERGQKPKTRKRSQSYCLLYVKHYNDIWHIRLEVRLGKYYLNKFIPDYKMKLPSNLPYILNKLKEKIFFDFFSFAEIDFKGFYNDIRKRNPKYKGILKKLYKNGKHEGVFTQKHYMRRMANVTNDSTMSRDINKYKKVIKYKKIAKKIEKLWNEYEDR